jgi:hypothetical protein
MLSEDQAKFPFEKGCDQVAIGSGQMGSVHLSPEAEAYSKERAAKVLLKPTPEAIRMFSTNRARGESAISRGRARAFGRGIEEVVSGVIAFCREPRASLARRVDWILFSDPSVEL